MYAIDQSGHCPLLSPSCAHRTVATVHFGFGGAHEAETIPDASIRCGGDVAARGARTAGGKTSAYRIPEGRAAASNFHRRISEGTARTRPRRGPTLRDRVCNCEKFSPGG